MDFKKFLYVIENISSEIYLFILVFLLQNKPFTNSALYEYEKQKSSFLKVTGPKNTLLTVEPGQMVKSPNLNSKFSPSVHISRSPVLNNTNIKSSFKIDDKNESKNYLLKIAGLNNNNNLSINNNSNNSSNNNLQIPSDFKRTEHKSKTVQQTAPLNINIIEPTVPVSRKERHDLKNIDEVKPVTKDSKNDYEDLPITPATKISNVSIENLYPEEYKGDNIHEGHLYKITDNKQVKRLWFKLINRDLYCN
jgi:hypothetical protein